MTRRRRASRRDAARRGLQQPRASSRSGAARRRRRGTATFYLTKAADADPGRRRLPVQPRVRLRARTQLPGGDLLAARSACAAIRPTPTRTTCWRRRCRRPAARSRRSGRRSWPGSSRRATRSSNARAAADRTAVPRGLERVRHRSGPPPRAARRAAIVNTAQRDQRELAAFHLERGRRLYEREEDRKRWPSCAARSTCRPYEAQAHLLIGRILLRAGRPAGSGRCAEDLDLERGHRRGARGARRGLPEAAERAPPRAPKLERALALDPASADAKRILSTIK